MESWRGVWTRGGMGVEKGGGKDEWGRVEIGCSGRDGNGNCNPKRRDLEERKREAKREKMGLGY